MEEEGKRRMKQRRQLGAILAVSWLATACMAGLYTRELLKNKAAGESGWGDTKKELSALQEDYAAVWSKLLRAQEKQAGRQAAEDTALDFIAAYFIRPDSEEALLAGCQPYASEEVMEGIKVLATNRGYSQLDRELFYCRCGSSSREEEEWVYDVFALFTVREIEDAKAFDHSYMLSATVEADTGGGVITDIGTMTEIFFHAD